MPDIEAWLHEKLGELRSIEVEEPVVEEIIDQVAATGGILPTAYTGGIMSTEIALVVRDTYRAAGMTQDAAAQSLGISRPQLANALRGRFGLSTDAAAQMMAWLAHPPPVIQARLI